MNIDIFLSQLLVDEQKRKYDIYVVIDLFRATTAFCTAFNYGIKEIIPFADMEEARAMKRHDFLIAGESKPTKRKIDQAKQLNIKIISEKEWNKILNS